MGLLHKTQLTDVSTVISVCRALAKDLYRHYQTDFADRKSEWNDRSKTFENSGIGRFSPTFYSNSPLQFNKSSIHYSVREQAGPVLPIYKTRNDYIPIPYHIRFTDETDVVYVKLLDEIDRVFNTRITLQAIIPESVFRKKYANLRLGDRIGLNGPIAVRYIHNEDPFSMTFDIYVSP